jgi:predicted transcriptional regulator
MNSVFNVEINNPEAEAGKFTEQEEHIKKILRALFDLTKKQIECYLIIRKCQDPSICVNHLVGLMVSERSIIQKHMKVLFNKGLITRESVTLNKYSELCASQNRKQSLRQNNRGYLFVYNSISNQELQDKIDMKMDTWKQSIIDWNTAPK